MHRQPWPLGGAGAHLGAHRGGGGGANVLVMTDACMPSAAVGEAPMGVPLLVNYDLPRTKEAYARRVRLALGGGGGGGVGGGSGGGVGSGGDAVGGGGGAAERVVVNVVAAAEAGALRAMESVTGIGGEGSGSGSGIGGEDIRPFANHTSTREAPFFNLLFSFSFVVCFPFSSGLLTATVRTRSVKTKTCNTSFNAP